MSESTEKKSSKISLKLFLMLLACSLTYNATQGIAYIYNNYLVLCQDALGYDLAQIGNIQSVIGVCSIVGTLCGGILADRVNCRKLCMLANFAALLGGAFYFTMPGYQAMSIAIWIIDIAVILPYYCALPKFMATFIDRSAHGKLWGLYAAIGAGFNFFSGLAVGAIVDMGSSIIGFRGLILFTMAEAVVALILLVACFRDTEKKEIKKKVIQKEKFDWTPYAKLLKEPDVWLLAIALTAAYNALIGNSYLSTLMRSEFGVSVGVSTIISSIGNYGFRLVGGTFFGILIDRFTPLKSLAAMLVAYLCVLAIVIVLPVNPSLAFAIIILNVLAVLFFRILGQSFNPVLSEVQYHIPYALRGTAWSIISAVQSIPGLFAYKVAGAAIEKNGVAGYKMVFGVLFAWLTVD